MPTANSDNRDLIASFCLIVFTLCMVQHAETYSAEELKLWQRYVDNEQVLAIERVLSHKGVSLSEVLPALHNFTRFYSTCRRTNIQFDDRVTFHSIWTVCSYLQVSVLSSTSTDSHTLEISAPTALGLNITTLKFGSDSDMVQVCQNKVMAVPQDNDRWDIICGNPYLERSSLVPHHNTTVFFRHHNHQESILMVSLHVQVTALLGRNIPRQDHYFSMETVTEKHLFTPSLQLINGKYYAATVLSLTASYDTMNSVNSYVPVVHIWSSNCNSDLSFAVYDGPYAGVLSTRGLVSPFELLVEGVCEDIPTSGYLSYNSSIGDLTIVVRDSLNTNNILGCQFEYVPALCPGESCMTTTVEVIHDKIQKWRSIMPRRPLIQIVKFITKNPDSYINLNMEVTEGDIKRPSGYSRLKVVCPTEGIFIYENTIKTAFLCSSEGISNLNRTMQENGGLQFNTVAVTIVLKMYPKTTKLKLSIWHTGTSCFGMINFCFNMAKPVVTTWKYDVGMTSCLPHLNIRDISQKILFVHLKEHCCFQWHIITFEENGNFDWQCASNFYAPQNGLYQWHIAIDNKQKQYDCLAAKYAATDYPLMYASQNPSWHGPPRPGVFVLEESKVLISAYIYMHLLGKCTNYLFVVGLKLSGNALTFAKPYYCNSRNVSYEGTQMENPVILSFIFEPFNPCAEVRLPTLPIIYSFMFNLYELKNNPYNSKIGSTCCFISLMFHVRPRVADVQDVMGYAVTNNQACDSRVRYTGIPQSLVLRHFSNTTFGEAFGIKKLANTSWFSIQYYFRARSKVQMHTYNYAKDHGCLNGVCVVCSSRKCYNIYGYSSPGNFSWNEANMLCRHNGSHLISLNDEYEWSYIAQLLDLLCANNVFVHLGLGTEVRYVVLWLFLSYNIRP